MPEREIRAAGLGRDALADPLIHPERRHTPGGHLPRVTVQDLRRFFRPVVLAVVDGVANPPFDRPLVAAQIGDQRPKVIERRILARVE